MSTGIRKLSCSRDYVGTWWDSVTVWCLMCLLRLEIKNISVHGEFIFWSNFVYLPLSVEGSREGTWVVIFWLRHDVICWTGTNISEELFPSSKNTGATGSSKVLLHLLHCTVSQPDYSTTQHTHSLIPSVLTHNNMNSNNLYSGLIIVWLSCHWPMRTIWGSQ